VELRHGQLRRSREACVNKITKLTMEQREIWCRSIGQLNSSIPEQLHQEQSIAVAQGAGALFNENALHHSSKATIK